MRKLKSSHVDSLDAPGIFAEVLTKTGLINPIITTLYSGFVTVPLALFRWLGQDLQTPSNSSPPRVVSANGQPISGLVVVHDDQPIYWLLATTAGSQASSPQRPAFTGRPLDPRLEDPRRGPQEPLWRNPELLGHPTPRWEEDEDWRR